LIRTEFKNEFGCRDITLLKHAMKNINLGGSTVVCPYVHPWCIIPESEGGSPELYKGITFEREKDNL